MHNQTETIENMHEKFYETAKANVYSSKVLWPLACEEIHTPPETVNLTCWPLVTELLGGFRMKEFTILCGATGVGKTALLANLSANLIIQRVKHFVAPVETGEQDFLRRVASILKNEDVNDGNPRPKSFVDQLEKDLSFAMDSEDLHLSVIDHRMPIELILQKLKYVNKELGCKIAILDNLNFFMEVKSAQNQVIEMDRVIHELIMFCKKIPIHVIMVMHPKKTDHVRVESEFDIKGSSTAVQEAQNVLLFNRPKEEEIKDGTYTRYHRELKVAKLRRRGKYVGRSVIFYGESPAYTEEDLI